MTRPLAPIAPAVLRWARDTAGLPEDEAARRIGLATTERLLRAERGEAPLTLNQARKAARVYDRPFAVLLLPAPPQEEPPEVQFRRLRDAPELPWPPAMRALSRSVAALQDEAAELFEALEEDTKWPAAVDLFGQGVSNVELADNVRELVGVSIAAQKSAARADPQGFRTFRLWREAIEDLGILVLQDGSLTLDAMRGFASPHERVPAIVLNTNDDVRSRLFTMLHEFAHIFWADRAEREYDEFAGEVVLPRQALAADFQRSNEPALLATVDALAHGYGVTSDALAVRLGWLGLVPWPDVQAVREEIRRRSEDAPPRSRGGNFYRNVVVRSGPGFVRRVLDGVDQGGLSPLGAARVLGVRVGQLEGLRGELRSGRGG
jgi:Zn-dependent peptidase ImmA (M78 family)/transcriptional regulator with XRE-family HTH domain